MDNGSKNSLTDTDFVLLLEDRTFVDYFNVFNSLPIFGQHVLYNYIEKEFEYEPPIRKRKQFTDRREVVKWLIRERYRLFEQTSLYVEFRLTTKLRDIDFNPETSKLRDAIGGEEAMVRYIFGRNVIGSSMGMQIFREFLRNTMGEKVYKCWMDIEKWRQMRKSDERKEHLKHYIKRNYIGEGGADDLISKGKYIIYQGVFNFTLMPDKDMFDDIIDLVLDGGKVYNADTDVAFLQLQKLLLSAMRRYWIPRFLIHVIKVTSKDILVLLKRESPGDIGLLTLSKRQRHRMTIHQIYSTATSCGSTPAPTSRACSNPTTPRPKSIAFTESETSLPASEPAPETGRESRVRFPENLVMYDDKPVKDEVMELYDEKVKDDIVELHDEKVKDGIVELYDDKVKAELNATKEKDMELKGNGGSDEDVIDEEFEEESNIQPDDLLSLWGGQTCGTAEKVASEKESSSQLSVVHKDKVSDSSDTHGLKELDSWQKSSESNYSFSNTDKIVNVPISITSYLSGRRRMATGSVPNISNRMLCALASDHLSGAPFREFLKKKGLELDMRYLSFWSDVRHYLDTEDGNTDCFGTPLRQSLAKTITERYLSSSSSDTEIFSEGLKMTLFASLAQKHDVSLLCSAQDIVSGMLKEPWGLYMKDERKAFRKRVCGKKKYDRHVVEVPSSYTGPQCKDGNDPLFFFNSSNLSPDDTGSRPCSGATGDSQDSSRPWSTNTNMDHVCLSEQQVWKAFEITVLCHEYGRSGMVPQTQPRIHDLVDVLYSDYGSLNIRQEATVRQEALRELVFPPKIDIENVRVSRKVMMGDAETNKGKEDHPRYNRLVLRRNGILIERPIRPKTFMEVLNNPVHYDFFKRYMVSNKMGYPLQFWSAVEELKETQGSRGRQKMVLQILKRFFSRGAKQGYLLDCSDDIIRQIPTMEKVPASVMVCAQASVFRSMERKWFPHYLETYPTDAEYRESMSESYPPGGTATYQIKEVELKSGKPRRIKRKKTMNLWHGFSNAILDFMRAMKDPMEVRLFEIYLKYETDRDHEVPSNSFDKTLMTSSAMDVQSRVVMRNRLVIFNKLANDLLFWIEVDKYRKQVETLKNLENISKSDSDLLFVKARAIIESFLVSEILPRVQINIPNELGHSIGHSLTASGPIRGLFHDATILLFPILYYFWKRFHESWLANANPEDVLPKIEAQKPKRVLTPHKDSDLPNFFNIRYSTVDVTQQNVYVPDDDRFKISFSMVHGMKLVYPIARGQKTGLDKHSTSQMSKRTVKPSHMSVSNLKKNAGESRTRLNKQNPADTSPKTQRMAFKIPIKILTPQQERAKKLSLLVEELNKHSNGKTKRVNKPLRSFDAVVNAALNLRKHGNPFADIDGGDGID